jgi:hypothetical protein
MAKTKRAGAVTRTSATPPTSGVPTEAPLRPALTAGSEEAETATARATNPHATGADRTSNIKAHLAAVRAKEAARKAARGKLPVPPKPAAKPVARTASKATAKAKKKSAAAKPAAATELY